MRQIANFPQMKKIAKECEAVLVNLMVPKILGYLLASQLVD